MAAGEAIVRAVFHCRLCGQVAAVVALEEDLTAPGQPRPPRLILEGFLGRVTEGLRWVSAALRAALLAGDARALYHQNQLWAPFYCPQCQAVYCRRHWQIAVTFDDDFPGWYDASYGMCPAGHRRLVDD